MWITLRQIIQIMSNLMVKGTFDSGFPDDYGSAVRTFEQSKGSQFNPAPVWGNPLLAAQLDYKNLLEVSKQVSRDQDSYGMLMEGVNQATIADNHAPHEGNPKEELLRAGQTVGFMESARYHALDTDKDDPSRPAQVSLPRRGGRGELRPRPGPAGHREGPQRGPRRALRQVVSADRSRRPGLLSAGAAGREGPGPRPALPPRPQLGSTGSSSGRCPSEAVAAATRSAGTSPYSVVRGRDGRPASPAMASRPWIERYEP